MYDAWVELYDRVPSWITTVITIGVMVMAAVMVARLVASAYVRARDTTFALEAEEDEAAAPHEPPDSGRGEVPFAPPEGPDGPRWTYGPPM